MSISKSILLLFFLLNFSTQKLRGFTIPGRDSFVPIKSGIQTLMELTPEKSELYFTFDNQFDSSDIIILAKKLNNTQPECTFMIHMKVSKQILKVNI